MCANASDAFSKVIDIFAPPPPAFPPGRHPSAVIHASAVVPASAHIGPCAVIDSGAVIGERTVIGAGVYIGEMARVGDDCLIYPNVTVRERCRLGHRVIIHAGTTVGSDGFGYISGPGGHKKVPQVGIVQLDDDVELGAGVTVDRARFGRTWLKRGTKVDNLVQIAHNVVIGEDCLIIAQVGISGSTHIGNRVIIAGQAGLVGHIEVGDGAVIMAQSGISKDVPPGAKLIGSPAQDPREFAHGLMEMKRLGRLRNTIRELQQDVAALKTRLAAKG